MLFAVFCHDSLFLAGHVMIIFGTDVIDVSCLGVLQCITD